MMAFSTLNFARRTPLCAAVVALALIDCHTATTTSGPHVLLVGTYKGKAGQYKTIQAAVDAASAGDWILVAPGD